MPLLDISEVLYDPDFADTFTVLRRPMNVDTTGVSIDDPGNWVATPNVSGVVYPEGGNALDRTPEAQSVQKAISVVSNFRLHTAAAGKFPDRVIWEGDLYECLSTKDYSRWGAGFTEVYCVLVSSIPGPVEGGV